MQAHKRQIFRGRKQISGCLAIEMRMGMTANGHKESFRGDGNVLKLDCGVSCTVQKIY